MRRLALLALALLAACSAAPPPAPSITAEPTPVAVASPTAPGEALNTPPTSAPATATVVATAVAQATTIAATPLPALPSALIGPESTTPLAEIRSFGHGSPYAVVFASGDELAVGTSAGLAWLSLPELRVTRLDPFGPIFDPALSPDGALLAHTVSFEGGAERSVLRRATGGERIAELQGTSPAFSPDGALLVTGEYLYGETRRAWLWRAADGTLVAELAGVAPRFSPTGTYVATEERPFEAPGTTRVYAAASGELLLEFEGTRPTFSSDERRIAVSQAEQVAIYALPEGTPVATIPIAGDAVMAFSADGSLLQIVAGADLIVWDIAANAERDRFPGVNRAEAVYDPDEPIFAPDATTLASFRMTLGDCPPGGVRLTNSADGSTIFEDDSSSGLAFSPDGTLAAMLPGAGVRTVSLPDATVADLELLGYQAIALSPSGATLAAATVIRDDESYLVGRIDLWDLVSGELRSSLTTDPEAFVFAFDDLRFSPDGARLTALARYGCAAVGFNGLFTWDIATGQQAGAIVELPMSTDEGGAPIDRVPETLAFLGDGSAAAWVDGEGATVLWRAGAGETRLPEGSLVTAMAFAPDGSQLAIGDEGGGVVLYDLAGDVVAAQIVAGATPRELRYSDDGSLLLAVLANDTLVAWQTADQAERVRFDVFPESRDLSLSADNSVLALNSPQGAALFLLADGTSLDLVAGTFDDAQLGPGRRLLATVGDGRALLWGKP